MISSVSVFTTIMNRIRRNSSPELIPPTVCLVPNEENNLEGVATEIKLLLKLFQDHIEVGNRDDGRRMQRVKGLLSVIDDIKHRIQKSESFGKKREAELRRCNTDLRRTTITTTTDNNEHKSSHIPKDKRPPPPEPITREEQRLRKELSASLVARRSLEMMFSSLGKEKDIIATELARKVQELNDTEEHVNDLRAQNEKLLRKVKHCGVQHRERGSEEREAQGNAALEQRNKMLSEELLKSLDGYRSLKRKLKEVKEENLSIHKKMAEMALDFRACLKKIHEFKQRISEQEKEEPVEIEEELAALEHMFQCFEMKISKDNFGQKRLECVKPIAEINAENPSVLA